MLFAFMRMKWETVIGYSPCCYHCDSLHIPFKGMHMVLYLPKNKPLCYQHVDAHTMAAKHLVEQVACRLHQVAAWQRAVKNKSGLVWR